jgi:acetyltransferase-like isoleucine patch superfamily enzyme
VLESRIGDYSYLAGTDGTVIYTEIGRFCSIASHAVINPGDHPMQRVTQHHCTYRRRRYGFGPRTTTPIFSTGAAAADAGSAMTCGSGPGPW